MDRLTNYFGQVPLETDLLHTNQNAMVGLAKLSAGVYGTNTLVNALSVIPTGPASLSVLLTAGEIYQIENLEATAWSSLAADNAHSVMKQGVLLDPLAFAITPPGTPGFSQVFLIEVQYQDLDTGSLVLPYYNAANPTAPFSGPANAGTAQNTVRKGTVAAQVKAGTAAPTGSQVAPTADAGWTGIYTVTVANGTVAIGSGNITRLASAPYLATNGYLPQIPTGVQNNTWTYAADTGTANNIVIAPQPAPAAYVTGMTFLVKVANANAGGATTVNVAGPNGLLGTKAVIHADASALYPFELSAGGMVQLTYDGTSFQCVTKTFSDIIDTPVVYTVHGAGANFTDLFAAAEFLSKYKITPNGSVLLSISAGRWSYGSSTVVFAHPNGDRISIVGQNLNSQLQSSDFTVTGNDSTHRATDRANTLAALRTRYTSELTFSGNGSLHVFAGGLSLVNLLFTSDRTGTTSNALIYYVALNGSLNNVSAHGCGGVGIGSNGGILGFFGTAVSASGCVSNGIQTGIGGFAASSGNAIIYSTSNDGVAINVGGGAFSGGSTAAVVLQGNGAGGVSAGQASVQFFPNTLTCTNNGGAGLSASTQSNIYAPHSTITSNAGWGVVAVDSCLVVASNSTFSGNTSGACTASIGSTVDATSATGVSGNASPAINTVGNSNSIVVN